MTNIPAIICEFFTPILVLAALIMPWFKTSLDSKLLTAQILASDLIISLVFTYSIMMLDNIFKIWPAAGLDYSTHTAFALSFTLVLYILHHWAWCLVLGVYCIVMNYLGYHTWLDMGSTFFVWSIFTLPCCLLINRKLASRGAKNQPVSNAQQIELNEQN